MDVQTADVYKTQQNAYYVLWIYFATVCFAKHLAFNLSELFLPRTGFWETA